MARHDDDEELERRHEAYKRYYWANREEILRRRHERDAFKRSDVWIPYRDPVTEKLRRLALRRAFYR